MSITFTLFQRPFRRWWGPFSPARGKRSGFRVNKGRLGVWVDDGDHRGFWSVQQTPGARALQKEVLEEWGGGRVLLLPNGLVVKPLQGDDERGRRVLVGQISGDVVLEIPGGTQFNMAQPSTLQPGSLWQGPTTTGLECVLQQDGSLSCKWYHPTELGRDKDTHVVNQAHAALAQGFRSARPGDTAGRVRVTAHGHVITNREARGGYWETRYVGHVLPGNWPHLKEWIE